MKKILMVCLGNICRSPMAEGLMAEKIRKFGLNAMVDSAGFESFHTGDPPDARAVKTMRGKGIDITGQRSRLFTAGDFDHFDHIFVMDRNNYLNVQSMARNSRDLAKVDYILNAVHPGCNIQVPDPYYGGDAGFENVFSMLDNATEQIARRLMEK